MPFHQVQIGKVMLKGTSQSLAIAGHYQSAVKLRPRLGDFDFSPALSAAGRDLQAGRANRSTVSLAKREIAAVETPADHVFSGLEIAHAATKRSATS